MVEFAIVLPLLMVLMAVAFNGWNALQLSIHLTSAGRAGAIKAANDLAAGDSTQTAWNDATEAVNLEEGLSAGSGASCISGSTYQNCDPSGSDYVSFSTTNQTTSTGIALSVVTVQISSPADTLIPIPGLDDLNVTAHGTATYS